MKKYALLTFLLALPLLSLAGTGGAEIQSWYTDISQGLQGFWGKVIAMAFIGGALASFWARAIIPALFLLFLGLGVGIIPNIVDARFTLTF